ncbi:MAG: beta/gamma crystallin-related protein, partial [Rubrivivax sp.]
DRVSSVRNVPRQSRPDEDRQAPEAPPAQLSFYEAEGFAGRTFTTQQDVGDFRREGFNDRASSVVVAGGQWEVCDAVGFRGRCVVLRPGQYASLAAMGLNDSVSSVRAVNAPARDDMHRAPAPPVSAQVTFYEQEGFSGRTFSTQQDVDDFRRQGFNDRASSAVVVGTRWEVCDAVGFNGRCVVLGPGQYASLAAMGLNDSVSSVRSVNNDARIDERRIAPAPVAAIDYRRRANERLYEANVVAVRAVVGTPEQRCWIEREQVSQDRGNVNLPAAVIGAVIGGVLGHQVGGGQGKDLATAGGAVAGAVVGANIGRDGSLQQAQDVQRCTSVPSQTRPDYWDVTYSFRGQEHRMQMSTPPGPTVTVNAQGEPRV